MNIEVLGIVNVTPDSFSDGGRYLRHADAIEHGQTLVNQGATILDVGGESTRPGATAVSAEEEQRRVLPVVQALAERGHTVSVDTMRASTAAAAIDAGATIINDVSAGKADAAMVSTVAASGVRYVAMHSSGPAGSPPPREPIVPLVVETLLRRADALIAAGIDPSALVLDPGLGFSKSAAQNWELLGALGVLVETGYPILVGHSRKRFVRAILPPEASTERLDTASAAIGVLAQQAGAWGVRVHDVERTVRFLRSGGA